MPCTRRRGDPPGLPVDWGVSVSIPGLVVIGCGGFGRETARAALDGGFPGEVLGFLDDDPSRAGATIEGLPVLGPIERAREPGGVVFVVATGRPDQYTSRHAIVARLGLPDDRYATVVHPAASLAGDTELGCGSVVLAGVVATAGVRIGAHVALMPQVVLTHDVVVDDFATVASSVALAGGTHVGRGAYLGAATLVRQGLVVGEWAMTGMGSLVLADVPAGRLWFGVPAQDRGPSPAADYRPADEPSGQARW
jgi:sugar O-acyltransferase (sialic acid O-acetyltransferase NeuD family)